MPHDLLLDELRRIPMTPDQGSPWVLGADVCRGKWAGIMWDGTTIKGLFAPTISNLVEAAAEVAGVEVVAIDIPIGLPEADVRLADKEAREFVGVRRASVFSTPIREALLAPDYAAARTRSLELTGSSLSAQAYALRAKILEVESWLAATTLRVVEVHPEVSFKAMSLEAAESEDGTNDGLDIPWPKSVWAGQQLRLDLLTRQGLELPSVDLGELAGQSPPDDIIDAAACAWTARRVLLGRHKWLPSADPEPPLGTAAYITY